MKRRHVIIALATAFIVLNVFVVVIWLLWSRPRSDSGQRSVLLVSAGGKRFVGDQLRFFGVGQDGVISATNVTWLNLYYTEGRDFRLSGEVWLDESSARRRMPDLPDGFALFVRESDSLHRYSLTTRSIEVKRRLNGGVFENNIVQVTVFPTPAFGEWVPFTAQVYAAGISYRIGEQSGAIPGSLDSDGANKIALMPGTRVRNLRLEVDGTE